jgi:hypothetical protein
MVPYVTKKGLEMTYEELILDIQQAAESGVRVDRAELLAGKCLFIMNSISVELAKADKDRRMRKRGSKAIRSAVRLEESKRHDKKPPETALDDYCNTSKIVQDEEQAYDEAEVAKEELQRQYDITNECHLYFRGISKVGSYNA